MSARADGRTRGRLGVGRGLRRPPPSFPPAVRTFIVQVDRLRYRETCVAHLTLRVQPAQGRQALVSCGRPAERAPLASGGRESARDAVSRPHRGKLKESRHRKQKLLIFTRAWASMGACMVGSFWPKRCAGPRDAQNAPQWCASRRLPAWIDGSNWIYESRCSWRDSRSGGTSGSAKHRKSGGCRALLSSSVSRRSR